MGGRGPFQGPFHAVIERRPFQGLFIKILQFLTFLDPECVAGVARHAPVASWTQCHTSYLWSVGQAGTLELLGEETAAEGLEPFLDGQVVVLGGVLVLAVEGYLCEIENLGWTETKTEEIIEEEVVELVGTH